MPQMAPYNWLNLYFMFTLILIYLTTYIYFIKKINMNKKSHLKSNTKFNWKW